MISTSKSHVYETLALTGENTVGEVFSALDAFVENELTNLAGADLADGPIVAHRSSSYNWQRANLHDTKEETHAGVRDPWHPDHRYQRVLSRTVRTFADGRVLVESLKGMNGHLLGSRYNVITGETLEVLQRDLGFIPSDYSKLPASPIRLDELAPTRRGWVMANALRIMNSAHALEDIADGQDPRVALAPLRKKA